MIQLPRIPRITRHGPISTPHTGQAIWATDPANQRRWVCKSARLAGDDTLIAEIIGWYLGRTIGIDVPDAAILDAPDDDWSPAWLTEAIQLAGHWSEAELPNLINPYSLGAMLALDAVLLNGDRHDRNVLLQPLTSPPAGQKLWCIDLGGAACGWPTSFSQADLKTPDLAQHLPLRLTETLHDHAQEAARRIAAIPRADLQRWAMEACAVVGSTQGRVLFEGLRRRCTLAVEITRLHLNALEERP